MGATVRAGGGFSKGLKGFSVFFLSCCFSVEDGGGGLGLLAREGEKRSWN